MNTAPASQETAAVKPIAMIEADDARRLADELEKLRCDHWMHWTAQEVHIAATAVRHLRLLANHNATVATNDPPETAMDSKPLAYAVFAPNGNIRIWSTNPALSAPEEGLTVTPLYAAPPSDAAMTALKELVEAHQQARAMIEEHDRLDAVITPVSVWNDFDERMAAFDKAHEAAWSRAHSLVAAQEALPVQREDDAALLRDAMMAIECLAVWTAESEAHQRLLHILSKLRERLKEA